MVPMLTARLSNQHHPLKKSRDYNTLDKFACSISLHQEHFQLIWIYYCERQRSPGKFPCKRNPFLF